MRAVEELQHQLAKAHGRNLQLGEEVKDAKAQVTNEPPRPTARAPASSRPIARAPASSRPIAREIRRARYEPRAPAQAAREMAAGNAEDFIPNLLFRAPPRCQVSLAQQQADLAREQQAALEAQLLSKEKRCTALSEKVCPQGWR